jgi:hypothetical protein
MIVYGPEDRIPLKIGSVRIEISPLRYKDRFRLLSYIQKDGGTDASRQGDMAYDTLKLAIKSVSGLDARKPNGEKIEILFDSNGVIEDDSLELLIRASNSTVLTQVAAELIADVYDFKIVGVSIDQDKKAKKKQS